MSSTVSDIVLMSLISFVLWKVARGSKAQTYVDWLESFVLAYEIERMAGEDEI